MKKVCVVGHFGFGENMLNGQTIKTKTVTAELEKQLGADQVMKIDTHGGAKALPKVTVELIRAFKDCENVIILPAQNGVKIFCPLCGALYRVFSRKIHYVVIGGWLPSLLKDNKLLVKSLKEFDGIYVETSTMRKALNKQGFDNVFVMPNFKELPILKPEDLEPKIEEPFNLCTFSRVMKEKGIEDAVEVVKRVNETIGRTVFCLDIYGSVEPGYEEWFDQIKSVFPEYIRYRGNVPFDKSVDVLKTYFALLFPTQFYTEGIPGTIIDAYSAGVPVISSMWESFADIVDEGVTGIGYEFGNNEAMEKELKNVAVNPDLIIEMKSKCLIKAKSFTPETAIKNLLRKIMYEA